MIHEIVFAGAAFFHPHSMLDSIGVETINGKIFVIHKVDEKETLYAISRRYGTPVDAIKEANPGLGGALEIGQILKVPYEKKATAKPATSTTLTHTVAPKETMYSISKMYAVTVDDIKQWNNLSDNNLSVGQELIVKKPAGQKTVVETKQPESPGPAQPLPIPSSGIHVVNSKETLYSVARMYGLTVAQLKAWNSLQTDELKPGQSILVAAPVAKKLPVSIQEEPIREPVETREEVKNETPPTAVASKSPTIKISESMKNGDEIIEAGVAELIDGTEGNRKYLALHKTAPVGTILKVRNEMNNREVFVRVMGKLPEASANEKVIIKLSRSAYDRLGAIDPKFRVELTYYK